VTVGLLLLAIVWYSRYYFAVVFVTDQSHISRGRKKNSSGYEKVLNNSLVKVDLRLNHFSIFHGQKFLIMSELEPGASADQNGQLPSVHLVVLSFSKLNAEIVLPRPGINNKLPLRIAW